MNEMISIKLQDLIEKRQRDEDFKTWLSGWYEGFTQLKQSLEELDETRDMLKSCSIAFGKLLALEGFQNLTIWLTLIVFINLVYNFWHKQNLLFPRIGLVKVVLAIKFNMLLQLLNYIIFDKFLFNVNYF